MDEQTDICPSCGDTLYIGSWPMCRGKGSHDTVRSRNASACEPMVYYLDRSGNMEVPPASNDPAAHAALTARGFTRHEMRPGREYSNWQRRETARITAERDRLIEQHERTVGVESREKRQQLYHDMQSMSDKGKDFARYAMERSEQKARARRPGAPEPMVHAMEYDHSNLDSWRR